MKIATTLLILLLLPFNPLISKDSWFIAVKHNDGNLSNLDSYSPLFPPKGRFYADPMLINHNDIDYIFFEDFNYNKGVISYVTVDKDLNISRPKMALECKTHLSFPFLFKENNTVYMIPESYRAGEVALYKAVDFPDKWKKQRVLLKKGGFDSILFKHNDLYWIFTSVQPENLQIYYSKSLFSKFLPHPINRMNIKGRNAGNVFVVDGKLIRPNMVSEKTYGHHIDLKEITELTPTSFKEKFFSKISPTWAPGLNGTHTISMNANLTVYDGKVFNRPFPLQKNNPQKYTQIKNERNWITKQYLPSLTGRILYVGVAPYTNNYHTFVKDQAQFETVDFDPRTAKHGSPYKHYTEDFLKFDPGYLYDHISLFGVLGHHYDSRSGELYNIDSQKKITAALEKACQLLKPNGTLMLGPDTVSFKPTNIKIPHINNHFWKNRLNMFPLDSFEIKFIGEGKHNLIWWGKKPH